MYLNVLDRLCYVILSARMNNIDWQKEYGVLINETYNMFKKEILKNYSNISEVYEMFQMPTNNTTIKIICNNKCILNKKIQI